MKNGLDEMWDGGTVTMFYDPLLLIRSGPPLILSFQNNTKVPDMKVRWFPFLKKISNA